MTQLVELQTLALSTEKRSEIVTLKLHRRHQASNTKVVTLGDNTTLISPDEISIDAPSNGVSAWHGAMGPRWSWRRSLFIRPVIALLLVLVTSSYVPLTEGVCDFEPCWNLFQFAQEHLGIRDEFPFETDASSNSRQNQDERCVVRRTFYICVKNKSRSCRSDLSFHSVKRGLENQLLELKCNLTGRVFQLSDIPPTTATPPPENDICTYTHNDTHAYCALYGDPHLRTFNGDYVTCRTEGVWPLIDNDYVTVQVTNKKHGVGYTSATSVSEVTVVVKSHECALRRNYMTFVAYSGYLPSRFIDGSFSAGPNDAVFIDEIEVNKHIEIYLRYIDTTIVIRQINQRFFNVALKMPHQIVNETLSLAVTNPDNFLPIQLCINSCPHDELIDYREILVQSHPVLTTTSRARRKDVNKQVLDTAVTVVVSRDEALAHCQLVGLKDYYLDSCVFDLMSTGDANFTVAVQLAQSDEFRLVPDLIKQHLNRTSLNSSDLAQWRRMRNEEDRSRESHVSGGGAALNIYFNYLTMFSIVIISHLNYIHKTTFVLLS